MLRYHSAFLSNVTKTSGLATQLLFRNEKESPCLCLGQVAKTAQPFFL